ncbi:MAG: hypothetical protein M3Z37_08460 [Candidatus Eremiobacteraeota bacterium]|nr:hypothetical protein [Candidatus Eremiobacteraeota bacterium]
METLPPRPRNPLNDWYSPYFGPVTLLLAAAVLVFSIEAGKYIGSQSLHNDVANVPSPAGAVRHSAALHQSRHARAHRQPHHSPGK